MSQTKNTPQPRPDARTFSIGELARELDVTTRTIRFYEDMGLLTPRRRGQTRIYSPADRVRLKLILRGKRLGFSLAESRELIELYNPASDNNRGQLQALMDKIHEKRAQLTQQLHDIEVMQLELDEAEQRCRETMQRITHHN
ncbi:transcriptional regulator [Alcanivorax sp. S71-1-4]|uniref:MerR family transcriptional regulator n=1 Tax=Alcanivorax sp. S71-1-4 TaxID=1177159 RepID=UPI0013588822|nr:MerR family DNA-binding transcriptional regulator [Alcanivorax sp. S71-1-4]KAF0809217.1 transcriptional regulator [Alcanivorax sp. S71-1-4]